MDWKMLKQRSLLRFFESPTMTTDHSMHQHTPLSHRPSGLFQGRAALFASLREGSAPP